MPIDRKTSNRVIWTLAALLLLGVFFAVRSATRPRLPIRVAQVQRGTLVNPLSTNGRVEPQFNFEAHALAPGTVKAIYVREGEVVAKGKLLIEIDDAEARSRVATALTGVRAAQANLDAITRGGTQEERMSLSGDLAHSQSDRDQAARDLASLQKLQATGAASTSEVASARQRLELVDANIKLLQQRQTSRYAPVDLEHARAELADAQAAYTAAQTLLDADNIRAPFAGTVYSVPVAVSDFVQQGDRILQMADLTRIIVRAYFDEPEIGNLQPGQAIRLTWAAKRSMEWHGHILHVPSTIISYGTRNVGEVLVQVDDADGTLLPNTNVTVTVTIKSVANALTVPREALHTDAGKDYVYVLLKDKLHRVDVQVGAINLTDVQILSGLQEGQTVATGTTDGEPLVDRVPTRIME